MRLLYGITDICICICRTLIIVNEYQSHSSNKIVTMTTHYRRLHHIVERTIAASQL